MYVKMLICVIYYSIIILTNWFKRIEFNPLSIYRFDEVPPRNGHILLEILAQKGVWYINLKHLDNNTSRNKIMYQYKYESICQYTQ